MNNERGRFNSQSDVRISRRSRSWGEVLSIMEKRLTEGVTKSEECEFFVTKARREWQLFKTDAYITITCIYPLLLSASSLSHDEPYLLRTYLEAIDTQHTTVHTHFAEEYVQYFSLFFSSSPPLAVKAMCDKSDSKHAFDPAWVAANAASIMRATYWWTDPAAFKSLWHKANPTRYESQSNRYWSWATEGLSPAAPFPYSSRTVEPNLARSSSADNSSEYKPNVFFHH